MDNPTSGGSRGKTPKRPSALQVRKAAARDRFVPLIENPDRVLFLDIETTGLSRYYDELTLVGYAMAGTYNVHIAGDNPASFTRVLRSAAALVTFNGTLFDIPFLKNAFEDLEIPEVHIDLRYAARRVGLAGGQKSIEQQLGIDVRDGLEDVDGRVAVLLWHQYLRGDAASLRKLIAYNHADVKGMSAILDHVVSSWERGPDLFLSVPKFFSGFSTMEGGAKPGARLPSARRLGRRFTTFNELFGGSAAFDATVVGVDLTGSEQRPSGFCSLVGSVAKTDMLDSDEAIVAAIQEAAPSLVSIDSPLSLPSGRIRVTDDDPGRHIYGIMRQCERTLKRRGVNVYPCLLPSMQRLTERGMRLAQRLRGLGYPVIESYPGAAQDIMGIPRKGAGQELLREGLANFGVSGAFTSVPVKHDELDAITSALVASFFLAGKYEALTGPTEGALIIPDIGAKTDKLAIGLSGAIGSGKTTAARFFEERGFVYARFSEVIDDILAERGLQSSRENRQRVGWQISSDFGQRWLCERVLQKVGNSRKVVIDGLRFPEDHAFFVEHFSSGFCHLHISAPKQLCRCRIGLTSEEFENVLRQPTEGKVSVLCGLAHRVIDNSSSIAGFWQQLREIEEAIAPSDHALGHCVPRLTD